MAGTITKLEIQKKNKERVNVFIDEQYALAVTLTVALELKKGQYLEDGDIERLQQQDQRNKAYHQALNYLGFRARSQGEMERYLREKQYAPAVVTDVVERLLAEGYMDDSAFAASWVAERNRLKPKSARALRYELRQKGLAEADIEAAIADLDEPALAQQALDPKLRQWRELDEQRFKQTAMGFLSRRGFGFDVVRRVVETAWQTLEEEEL